MSTLYDSKFYEAQANESLQSARAVLPELFRYVQPRSVLDVGCGVGTWLRAAGELGASELLGTDGDYVESHALLVPENVFLPFDLATGNLPEAVRSKRADRFDLVICLEVAEHLPFDRAAGFVDDLCQLGDLVLFSAAIPFQYGTGHVNEQWPEFWAMHFRARGYACFDLLRPQLWAKPGIEWWYAQNMLVFAKEGSEASAKLPPDTRADGRSLAKVHPGAWLSTTLNLWFPHRAAARVEEPEDLKAVMRAWCEGASEIPALRAPERARTSPPDAKDVFPLTRTEVAYPEQFFAALAQAEAELTKIKSSLAQAEAELTKIKSSFYWRLADPARALGRLLSRHLSR